MRSALVVLSVATVNLVAVCPAASAPLRRFTIGQNMTSNQSAATMRGTARRLSPYSLQADVVTTVHVSAPCVINVYIGGNAAQAGAIAQVGERISPVGEFDETFRYRKSGTYAIHMDRIVHFYLPSYPTNRYRPVRISGFYTGAQDLTSDPVVSLNAGWVHPELGYRFDTSSGPVTRPFR